MKNSEFFRALKDIQSKDPDGGQIEPTEEMYRSFKEWAIRTYGEKMYNAYEEGEWGEEDPYYASESQAAYDDLWGR